MKIINYPDGSSYVKINDAKSEEVFRINSYTDLWHLNQIVDAYNNLGIKPTITIPNLIDAQADRRFNKDESSGLKLVCKFLNSMNANFKIFHPHNPEVVEALMDNVTIIDNTMFIRQVLTNMGLQKNKHDQFISDNLCLVSSDAGGFKPLMKLCDNIKWGGQVHSCSKSRSYNGKKSELTQRIGKAYFHGKDILIIDDICVKGGTFKGLAGKLKTCNVGKLYLAVSHITVQHFYKSEDPVFNYFDKIFTTNSKFDKYWVNLPEGKNMPDNLEIIKMF